MFWALGQEAGSGVALLDVRGSQCGWAEDHN